MKSVDSKLSEDLLLIRQLRDALEKIAQMNRQHAKDQFGNADKAEGWACVLIAREAIKLANERLWGLKPSNKPLIANSISEPNEWEKQWPSKHRDARERFIYRIQCEAFEWAQRSMRESAENFNMPNTQQHTNETISALRTFRTAVSLLEIKDLSTIFAKSQPTGGV